ncbi:sugar phosphate isomerase/epimerase family protein [Methanothermococcus okinawensis]|uniref:Xylose isomerase domain-containing protein TIM barrel n=1 Tax=Methanothermococcus okinawensis (strain DSM 14208 / JCM 11175 / IH1) TaxID=647113 RepID=F8AMP7_METOI|nr:sugar phosphate isomerase/epimerase family protein [Methanothermococcus okinawensis]AEH06878.1 Xylose isomerase domain-containing protein TIM barrel [Methanothermococcus okinawensis IH1]
MRIGISSSIFLDSDKDLKYALEYLEKKVRYVELNCDGNINVMEKENMDIPNSYDLNYTLHCPLTDLNLSSFRDKIRKVSLDFVEDILKTADKVNANLVVLHPGYCVFKYDYKKSLNALIQSLKDLNNIQKEYSIKITIENMPSYSMFMFREPTDEIINNLGDLGITFDIGHSFLNKNMGKFLDNDELIKKISHIHIHDNNGEFDEHLAIGKGRIDFEKYKGNIKKIKGIKLVEMQNKSINDLDLCITRLKNLLV